MQRPGLFLGAESVGGNDVVLAPLDLTTHAFCVGMTGSGKTGLCSVLLEEVLAQGIPVIAVDPKGDLGNLCLALDPQDPEEFRAWLPPGTAPTAAESAARSLADGLAASGLSREDLLAYRGKRRARIVTPGATFGAPVNVLGAMAPAADPEDAHEAADTVVRALLGLLNIDADPVQSREYLLLNALVNHAFSQGRSVELADLVRGVADPPFPTIGALPLEIFYPQKDRTRLMLALNGLLASPSFAAWRTGEPMDLDAWLGNGPQLTVYSIAHLEDAERLFAVALLLDRVKSWMRKQPGTGQLRAVLYLDEIYGYFPPHPADPPTKRPLLTLLKQARAFGVGVVLATQNPIDLDYKGLANTGTWMVGRLQTEQDRARLRDGLTAAATSGGTAAPDIGAMLSQLEKRVFLLHSVHRGPPKLFKSRYAYSFLRGPLSREEVTRLARTGAPGAATTPPATPEAGGSSVAGTGASASGVGVGVGVGGAAAGGAQPVSSSSNLPVLSDGALGPLFARGQSQGSAHVLIKCAVRYKLGKDSTEELTRVLAFPVANAATLDEALESPPREVEESALQESAPPGFAVLEAPDWLGTVTSQKLTRLAKARLPGKLETRLWSHPESRLLSRPGETQQAFLARAEESMGRSTALTGLQTKLDRKRRELQQATEQLSGRKAEKWASVGSAVLGNLGLVFGKKRSVSGVGGVISKHRMEGAAEGRVELLTAEIQVLERQLAEARAVSADELSEQLVTPAGRDLALFRVAIAYL
ncbi:MAG: DUF87 domain-containing protein [Myxococcota bacterium]|nr:DUF87 domain-containing protein [Myxococcota bacterium]